MASTIKYGEGFTIRQVLDTNGFTLDTGEISDLMDDMEGFESEKSAQLSNEEILKFLNVEDDTEDPQNNESENVTFVGLSFDTIKSKMHSIYNDGEVMKLVKKEGTGDVIPKDAQVTVQYVGYFEYQEEPFDSTFYMRDKKIIFNLGKGNLIPGLDIAISSMRKHEKSLFLIQPNLAYGALGCLPRVPPNSEVLFKIDLLDFLDNGQADMYDKLDNEEKKQFPAIEKIVQDLMRTAADSFKREKTKQAIRDYSRVVNYLETAKLQNDEEEQVMNKLLTRALTNLTVCYNKVGKPKLACASFQKLPNQNDPKALFQNGKALRQLGDYDEAMIALQKAHSLSPTCEDILREIKKVEEFRQKYLDFTIRFAKNSLKLTDNTSDEGFEEVAKDMCDTFIKDANLTKQQIPSGLSAQEQDCIRRIAASCGLSITKQNRRGEETMYLTKKSNYTRDRM